MYSIIVTHSIHVKIMCKVENIRRNQFIYKTVKRTMTISITVNKGIGQSHLRLGII